MKYTLGIDFGGSSTKAVLLSEAGRATASSVREYSTYSEHDGWAEQDADELCRAMFLNIRSCLGNSGTDPRDIAAVAVDAATHIAVLCDENDRPVRRVIHWSDSRSTEQARALRSRHADLLEQLLVNEPGAAWTLPQLMWLRDNEPQALARTHKVYFLKDYLRHQLTGDHLTDSIEVTGSMLANDWTGVWSPELCALAGIRPECLPRILRPDEIAGTVTPEAAAQTGLVQGTPVIVGSTDTALEILSAGSVRPGQTTVKLATAGRICPITDRPLPGPQFYNYRHIVPGLWYPGTATRSCAASYTWFRDVFGDYESSVAAQTGRSSYQLLDDLAEQVPAGCGGLMFHPYLLGEMSPYCDDSLCASFVGARKGHGKGHFARAVMEGVAFSMRDCLDEILRRDVTVDELYAIGGGTKGRLWRQILCEVLGRPLICMSSADSSLGSAMLAAVSVGFFRDYEECAARCVGKGDMVVPDPANVRIYDRCFANYQAYQTALAQVYHTLG